MGHAVHWSERRIVAACNIFEDGTKIIGVRHWDMFMRKQADAYDIKPAAIHEQGFIDQFGDFWGREEALDIVKANGQYFDPERNSHNKTIEECKELYSEGVW